MASWFHKTAEASGHAEPTDPMRTRQRVVSLVTGEITMKIYPALIVTLLVILFQACSATDITSTATSTSRIAFSDETSIDVDELEIKSEMNSNILTIKKISLSSGRLVFKLSSPDGHTQLEEVFTAPADYQHTFDLKVIPGAWKLEIELKNATGNYDIQWRASD